MTRCRSWILIAIYPGCKVRASLRLYNYGGKGTSINPGISFGLNNVQKLADGPRLATARGDGSEFGSLPSRRPQLTDVEAAPVAIHGVQHLVHNPVHMTGWPDEDRRSRIVFIVDEIDPDLVRRSLAAFNRLDLPQAKRV